MTGPTNIPPAQIGADKEGASKEETQNLHDGLPKPMTGPTNVPPTQVGADKEGATKEESH